MIRKGWPFDTGDCLMEVTTLTGLTVYIYIGRQNTGNLK